MICLKGRRSEAECVGCTCAGERGVTAQASRYKMAELCSGTEQAHSAVWQAPIHSHRTAAE